MKKILLLSLIVVISLGFAIWDTRLAHGQGATADGKGAFSNSSLSGTYIFEFAGSIGAQLVIPGGGGSMLIPPGTGSCPGSPNVVPCPAPVSSTFPALQRIGVVGTFTADGFGDIVNLSGTVTVEQFNTPPSPGSGLSYSVVVSSCPMSLLPTPPSTLFRQSRWNRQINS